MRIYTTTGRTIKQAIGATLGWLIAIVVVAAIVVGGIEIALTTVRTVWYNVL